MPVASRKISYQRRLPGPPIARQTSALLYAGNLLPLTLAVGEYPLYSTGVGGTGQGFGTTTLTFTETNMPNGSRMSDQTRWVIREIGFAISNEDSPSEADCKNILWKAYLRLEKPDFQFVYGPPAFWPGGVGLHTAATTIMNNGMPTKSARNHLKTPIVFEPGETFKFTYNATASSTLSQTTVVFVLLYGDVVNAIVS